MDVRSTRVALLQTISSTQLNTCNRFDAPPFSAAGLMAGIASNVLEGAIPLNGLRHPRDFGASGWFIWGGEVLSPDADFFKPNHVEHVIEWRPEIEPYLALPPGWRFLIAPGSEDVWYDETLLHV